jgi:CheY-like chemotaxis protein
MHTQTQVEQPEPMSTAHCSGAGLDQLKTEFLASLNHEIRTPLSGIIGMTDLLLETSLTADQEDYVASARVCAENLLELLNTALEYSALAAGTLLLDEYEFGLAEVLQFAVAENSAKAQQKGLALEFFCDEGLPQTVIGDPRRLRQMVSHLIANAVKFTPAGHVAVRAASPGDGELVVTVEDTGIGIERSKLSMIFESFRQIDSGLSRSYPGLGLGLSLSQKIAALQGGSIAVESEPGAGSRFTVHLPLRSPPPAASEGLRSSVGTETARILVVEDDRVSQTVISHVLRRQGFRVECAGSGAKAVAMAAREPFDLILMDLQMPEIDGLQATALIRALPDYGETPIIALTANYSDQCREDCQRHGMQGFLSKPVLPAELLAYVKRFV